MDTDRYRDSCDADREPDDSLAESPDADAPLDVLQPRDGNASHGANIGPMGARDVAPLDVLQPRDGNASHGANIGPMGARDVAPLDVLQPRDGNASHGANIGPMGARDVAPLDVLQPRDGNASHGANIGPMGARDVAPLDVLQPRDGNASDVNSDEVDHSDPRRFVEVPARKEAEDAGDYVRPTISPDGLDALQRAAEDFRQRGDALQAALDPALLLQSRKRLDDAFPEARRLLDDVLAQVDRLLGDRRKVHVPAARSSDLAAATALARRLVWRDALQAASRGTYPFCDEVAREIAGALGRIDESDLNGLEDIRDQLERLRDELDAVRAAPDGWRTPRLRRLMSAVGKIAVAIGVGLMAAAATAMADGKPLVAALITAAVGLFVSNVCQEAWSMSNAEQPVAARLRVLQENLVVMASDLSVYVTDQRRGEYTPEILENACVAAQLVTLESIALAGAADWVYAKEYISELHELDLLIVEALTSSDLHREQGVGLEARLQMAIRSVDGVQIPTDLQELRPARGGSSIASRLSALASRIRWEQQAEVGPSDHRPSSSTTSHGRTDGGGSRAPLPPDGPKLPAVSSCSKAETAHQLASVDAIRTHVGEIISRVREYREAMERNWTDVRVALREVLEGTEAEAARNAIAAADEARIGLQEAAARMAQAIRDLEVYESSL